MKKFLLFVLLGLSLSVSLTGCNTIHGAGRDVADTGHNIEHAANQHLKYWICAFEKMLIERVSVPSTFKNLGTFSNAHCFRNTSI